MALHPCRVACVLSVVLAVSPRTLAEPYMCTCEGRIAGVLQPRATSCTACTRHAAREMPLFILPPLSALAGRVPLPVWPRGENAAEDPALSRYVSVCGKDDVSCECSTHAVDSPDERSEHTPRSWRTFESVIT